MANIFARMWNFMTGWMHHSQSRLEATRPEIVYESALRDQRKKYSRMEEAVSGIVYNRNRINQDLKEARDELREVQSMLEQAIKDAQSGDQAVAEEAVMVGSMLQEQEEQLLQRIDQLTESRDAANVRIEEYQGKLVEFQGRIKRLADEKSNAVAQAQVDRETVRLNRELSGMGGDDESQSLNELRDRLGRLHAQASMTTEMRGKSLDERMRQYKLKAKSESARSRFLERVQDRPLAGGATADQKSLQSGGDAS